jgi:hypothetical protein
MVLETFDYSSFNHVTWLLTRRESLYGTFKICKPFRFENFKRRVSISHRLRFSLYYIEKIWIYFAFYSVIWFSLKHCWLWSDSNCKLLHKFNEIKLNYLLNTSSVTGINSMAVLLCLIICTPEDVSVHTDIASQLQTTIISTQFSSFTNFIYWNVFWHILCPSSASSSALQPWVGVGLLKYMSPATSILGIRQAVSTTEFSCVFIYSFSPSWFRSATSST